MKFPVALREGLDGWIVAECVAIPGCISQGRTRDEALANIREAIELCLEDDHEAARHVEMIDVEIAA